MGAIPLHAQSHPLARGCIEDLRLDASWLHVAGWMFRVDEPLDEVLVTTAPALELDEGRDGAGEACGRSVGLQVDAGDAQPEHCDAQPEHCDAQPERGDARARAPTGMTLDPAHERAVGVSGLSARVADLEVLGAATRFERPDVGATYPALPEARNSGFCGSFKLPNRRRCTSAARARRAPRSVRFTKKGAPSAMTMPDGIPRGRKGTMLTGMREFAHCARDAGPLFLLVGLVPGALGLGRSVPQQDASVISPTAAKSAPSELDIQVPAARPRAGLGAEFHTGRRALLLAELRKSSPTGLVLVRGLPPPRDYTRFQQDKTFLYLTGVESPDAALLLDVESGAEVLLLPPRSAMRERWDGELWDVEDAWVKEVTGFQDVRPTRELAALLKEKSAATKVMWISKAPWVTLSGCQDRALPADRAVAKDLLDGRASREDALEDRLREKFGFEVKDCSNILGEMRRVKTVEEIAALKRAAEAGARAMAEAVRSTRVGIGEWQLEAVMSFVHRLEGANGPAYHGIVGCGVNTLVLHYSAVSRQLGQGEMLLLDYAPEFDYYTSDITRSWPVDGVFTPRMAEIYDAVLEAQQAGIDAVQPGKRIRDVEEAVSRVLAQHGMKKLMPHGACHYIGMEVHDVGSYDKPLEPGVAFTIEPGVYEAATGIGVRIEDVVVVTKSGCEVITASVPRDRAALIALIAEEGVLDRFSRPKPLPEPLGSPQRR